MRICMMNECEETIEESMDSPAEPKLLLPIIEFSVESMSMKSTWDAVRKALETYGCFVIEYEQSSSDLHDSMFRLSEELFRLPTETKRKHTSQLAGFGYGGNFSIMPHFEYFGIQHDATDLQSKKDFAALFWPHGNDPFCEKLDWYSNMLVELERRVMRMVCSSYGLDKYYEPLTASSFYMTRLMKYGAPGENQSNIGILPHRDKNFLAVIGTNHVPGLEIQTPHGDWISFHPSPKTFIVIVGEPLMAWSNGRIYCPLHRVVARGTQEKYSIGSFSFVRGVLTIPEELVDEETPLKFKPFKNLDFLEYCKNGGPTLSGAIHTFCGL